MLISLLIFSLLSLGIFPTALQGDPGGVRQTFVDVDLRSCVRASGGECRKFVCYTFKQFVHILNIRIEIIIKVNPSL